MKLATGLINTMVNNALQTSNKTTLPAPPVSAQQTSRDPKVNQALYDAIFSPSSMMMQGIRKVTPPGVPIPQPPVAATAATVPGIPSTSPYAPGFTPLSPEDIASVMGIGQKAGKVASAAGFNITIPKQDDSLDVYLNDQLNKANTALTKLGTDKNKLIEDRKKITDDINKVLQANNTEALQQTIIDLIDKSRDIKQKVTTTRDFFVEKDKNGKERLSNRGSAVLALTILSQFFGAPGQFQQTSMMATALGDRYAAEQNRLNENLFKNQLDDFNKKIQTYQAQIGLKTQKAQRELAPLQSQQAFIDKQLAQNFDLTKDQAKAISDTVKEISVNKIKAGSTEEKTIISEAYKQISSGDPYLEALGYATLKSRNYPVEAPTGPSVKAQERQTKIDYQKALEDDLKNKAKRDDAKLELQRRGVVVDEKKIDELIRHNGISERIQYSLGLSRGGGTGQKKLSWLDKFELTNYVRDGKNQINDIDKQINKLGPERDAAFRNLNKIATVKSGRWVYDPAKDTTGSYSQADVNSRHSKWLEKNSTTNSLFDSRTNLTKVLSDVGKETGLNILIPMPTVPRKNDIGGLVK